MKLDVADKLLREFQKAVLEEDKTKTALAKSGSQAALRRFSEASHAKIKLGNQIIEVMTSQPEAAQERRIA